jgi:methyltransferase-like protein
MVHARAETSSLKQPSEKKKKKNEQRKNNNKTNQHLHVKLLQSLCAREGENRVVFELRAPSKLNEEEEQNKKDTLAGTYLQDHDVLAVCNQINDSLGSNLLTVFQVHSLKFFQSKTNFVEAVVGHISRTKNEHPNMKKISANQLWNKEKT